MTTKKSTQEIMDDPDFKEIVRTRGTVSWILTILELVLYFGFVALIAYNREFLSQKLTAGKAMTIGIPIAVGTIALSWVFTGIYIWWANNKYDTRLRKIREKIGG